MEETEIMKDRCSKLDENSKAIVDDCIGQKTVGDFFLCPLEDIVEIENENSINEIELRISTPFGENQTRRYDKPYIWDENKFFPKLVKNHGYGEGNWNNIIGDELLLRYNNNKNQWHLAFKIVLSDLSIISPCILAN